MKKFCIQSEHVRGEPRMYIVWESVEEVKASGEQWKVAGHPDNDWTTDKSKAERLMAALAKGERGE